MRQALKTFWLLWLCLLLSILTVKYVNAATQTSTIDPDLPRKYWYQSRLDTLRLWNATMSGTLREAGWRLKFTDWLIVWEDSVVISSNQAVIGWWKGNTIHNADYAWIGWWESNTVKAWYALIGWGKENTVNSQDDVILGWQSNESSSKGVVMWWKDNKAEGWIVLGWSNNTGHWNSLVLWHGSSASAGNSFVWNGAGREEWYDGYIGATNWILIGTTTSINWVNLVVGGSVRVAWTNDNVRKVAWEIRYVGGCFYGYDGDKWHVLNRGEDLYNHTHCTWFDPLDVAQYCEFGNTVIWNNDKVTGYSRPYSTDCASLRKEFTCINWSLSPASPTGYYPYCYTIHK